MAGREDSPWSAPGMVSGFARSAPNPVLMRMAEERIAFGRGVRALDLGCGAGRNAVPLARMGWQVLGVDDSAAMLAGAARLGRESNMGERLELALASMDRLPARSRSFDMIVAHGIWNLARSGAEFRSAVHEAARVSKPGAALFVFTFSRHTLPAQAQPLPGESFVFTQFSGTGQVFLTEAQLSAELAAAGFEPDALVPLTEYNRPAPGSLLAASGPVIYEAGFRFIGA